MRYVDQTLAEIFYVYSHHSTQANYKWQNCHILKDRKVRLTDFVFCIVSKPWKYQNIEEPVALFGSLYKK